MIGQRLGPYEVIEEIGRGGMATVYRAYQPSAGRYVAIKVIHYSIANDPMAVERFQREARLIARLEHPHLLPLYDVDALHIPPYIVMRYLEGGTLREILDRTKSLPLGDIAYLLRQIAAALDYAHRQGVVHRDIKPSNLMVDQDGNAFLMDFGVARLVSLGGDAATMGGLGMTLTQGGFAVGTPGYMSPEQCMGLDKIDARADIYSLGVMLFEMVTGTLPFVGETPMSAILKHLNDPVPSASALNAALPPGVDNVIRKAMAKKPEDRQQTATELTDDFTKALGSISRSMRPTLLREGAEEAVQHIRERRGENQAQIDATMAEFEALRPQTGQSNVAARKGAVTSAAISDPDENVPTILTPTPPFSVPITGAFPSVTTPPAPQAAVTSAAFTPPPVMSTPSESIPAVVAPPTPPATATQGSGGRIIMLVAALGVVIIGALFLLNRPQSPEAFFAIQTDTAAAIALVQAPTNTAIAQAVAMADAASTAAAQALAAQASASQTVAVQTIAAVTTTPGAIDATNTPNESEALLANSVAAGQTALAMVGSTGTAAALTATAQTSTNTLIPLVSATVDGLVTSRAVLPAVTDVSPTAVTPTLTATNTLTATATDTPAPTNTATVTLTATPSTPEAVTFRQLAARQGPDSDYPIIATLAPNERLTLLGISEDGIWYQVRLQDGTVAWLTTSFVNAYGDVNNLPIAQEPTETFTPTYTPTDVPSATLMPTDTLTATLTDTALPTSTNTPTTTPTDTPSATNTPIPPTATDTATLTPPATFTDTPTLTLTPTDTATAIVTPSVTASPTDTATPAPTETSIPTATPIPFGQLPYAVSFEAQRILANWDFGAGWTTQRMDGQGVLVGWAAANQPLEILGLQTPEWASVDPLVIAVSFNLSAESQNGFRLIFKASDEGYQVVQFAPDAVSIGTASVPFTGNSVEQSGGLQLGSDAPTVTPDQWHRAVIWTAGDALHVYLDDQLVLEGSNEPLPPGRIFFQMSEPDAPVLLDDLVVQRPEPASTSFEDGMLPPLWTTSNDVLTSLGEDDGNGYLRLEGDVSAIPSIRPLPALQLSCSVYIEQGGARLNLRQVNGGTTSVALRGGGLLVTQTDAAGAPVGSFPSNNYYGVGVWEQISIAFIGDRIEVVNNGVNRFSQTIPLNGGITGIEFVSDAGDAFRLDDCLILEGIPTDNLQARPFLALRARAEQLPSSPENTIIETFDNAASSDRLWFGGDDAAGEIVSGQLTLTHTGAPTWRLLRDDLGNRTIFGRGSDRQNFSDATNIYAAVDVTFAPDQAGTAWFAVRAARSLMTADLDGYRIEIRRGADGRSSVIVRYISAMEQVAAYGAPLAVTADETIRLEVIAFGDQLAFFANGAFLTVVSNSEVRGGEVGIGVEANTSATFDNLIVRDLVARR